MITFREAARTGDFSVSAELFLNADSSAWTIAEQVKLLKGRVDGVLLTDNQFGQLHMSTLAAASLVIANEMDPIVHLSCRNRNRIALLSDLLGAGALGVTSLLLTRGNLVPEGFNPRPKAVMDLDATELIATATRMRTDERLSALPDFYVGGVVTPHHPEPGWKPGKLVRKIEAGAQFMMTNVCMDVAMLRDWFRHLVNGHILRQVSVMVSIAIPESADDARWLCENRRNFQIPEAVIKRLEQAPDPAREGIEMTAEMLDQVRTIPGVSGVHLIATRNLSAISEALGQAGLRGAAA